jgi:tRNA/rRNA methyltransferase
MTVAPVVVLCRPQLGENIGATARAMMNFGLAELRLVRPECGWPNAKAVAAASGAVDVLNALTRHPTPEAAIADLHHVFATTARARDLRKPVVTAETAAREAVALARDGRRVGVLFGAERTGLENEELLLADRLVTIPTSPAFASLNLAQAVLVVAYEWFKAAHQGPAPRAGPAAKDPPASKGDIDGLLDQLLRELDTVGYFRSQDGRARLTGAIKMMVERRGMTVPEVNLFRGIVKELVGGRRPPGSSRLRHGRPEGSGA